MRRAEWCTSTTYHGYDVGFVDKGGERGGFVKTLVQYAYTLDIYYIQYSALSPTRRR